ncbi:hypothetical protein HPB52_021757 [Rhipicephalus sanguineus]|uniref:Uncharacterized protein n=1 Tax=Rhipicephalus sanguineus TaxID=34632 RepID=A0A9D4T7Z8_RHISA|nr:hypothetical protein HPB52_021757 [Rhipicephalus sanguineus]
MPHAERSSVSAVWYPQPRGRLPLCSQMPIVWGSPPNSRERVLSEAEDPATPASSSTRSNHPCPGRNPHRTGPTPQRRWFSKENETSRSRSRSRSQSFPPLPSAEPGQQQQQEQQQQQQQQQQQPKSQGQKTTGQQQGPARQQSSQASSKPVDKPKYNHPSAGNNNKVSYSAEAAKPIAPLRTQSTEYEHLLAENVKRKRELAAVRARQARDSAQLHALMARLGSPPDSPEHPSLPTPDRQKTSEIAISVPTATGTAVTRGYARCDCLETRLESQIAETIGSTRSKRATRSSRSVTKPASNRLSLESHASELFSTPASTLGTLTLTPTSASQADIPTSTPFHTTN